MNGGPVGAKEGEWPHRAGVEATKKSGYYADGDGLYLQVAPGGRSWMFRYQVAGRRRDMGLGPLDLVTLAEARSKALAARRQVPEGMDSLEAKRAALSAARPEAEGAELRGRGQETVTM